MMPFSGTMYVTAVVVAVVVDDPKRR